MIKPSQSSMVTRATVSPKRDSVTGDLIMTTASSQLFKSADHFDQETFEISKHLKSTKLNVLRTAIANRYGYKSIQAFKKSFENAPKASVTSIERLPSKDFFDPHLSIKEDFGILVIQGRISGQDPKKADKPEIYKDLFANSDDILAFEPFDGYDCLNIGGHLYGRVFVNLKKPLGLKKMIIGEAIMGFCEKQEEYLGGKTCLALLNRIMDELKTEDSITRKVFEEIHSLNKKDPSLFKDFMREKELNRDILNIVEDCYVGLGHVEILETAEKTLSLYSDSEKLGAGKRIREDDAGLLDDETESLFILENMIASDLCIKRVASMVHCMTKILSQSGKFFEKSAETIDWDEAFRTLNEREHARNTLKAFFGMKYISLDEII